MTAPWETKPWDAPLAPWHPAIAPPKPLRPELQRDPVTGLWPGQQHTGDIPDFLRRTPK
jgi:hypothetical protein